MFNELQNDVRLWQRYQFWSFIYETGNPVIYSAMRLRDALEAVVATVDPDGRDPAMREMVLVGHSQGGLLVKLMAVDLEDQIRAEFLPVPVEELPVSAETRELIRRGTAVHPLPFVRRVIFLATPHRGSYVAGSWLAQQLSHLVRVPGQVLRLTREMLENDPELQTQLAAGLSSVQGMTPGSPLVTMLAPAPLAPWITGHSIIAVQGEGPREEASDGVVAYTSAHIDGVESELVVRSGHSVQGNPEAIEEVRRILLDQAGLQ